MVELVRAWFWNDYPIWYGAGMKMCTGDRTNNIFQPYFSMVPWLLTGLGYAMCCQQAEPFHLGLTQPLALVPYLLQ